jgi:ATP-dependent exoDNAse (exonuclease V) beta subunit
VLRLYYVALTRAREGVYICDNATQNFVPIWSDE